MKPDRTAEIRRLSRPITGFAIALLAAGCGDATGPLVTTWQATFSATLAQPLSGRAAALTQAGRTQATISIENADPDTEYDWRINRGSCGAPGALLGGTASYPPLLTGTGGSASAEAALSELFQPGDTFVVRVLTAAGSEVSCATLVQIDS